MQRLAYSLFDLGQLSVIGPKGCVSHLPDGIWIREVSHQPLSRFLAEIAYATVHARRLSQVNLVLAGSGLTAPFAYGLARKHRAHFAVFLHGLDIVAPSRIYQQAWLPFIRRADLVLANSRNTRRLAIERGVPSPRVEILHPGTSLTEPAAGSGAAFRKDNGLKDSPVMLSVGRLTPRKGIADFVENALPAIVARNPQAKLVVIGDDARDAAGGVCGDERARILRKAAEAGVRSAVLMLPPCDDATLSDAYQAADVHIFPVVERRGDVEGFGMVAIEAAAHGLPTVAFSIGGVPDAVIDTVTGSLVKPGDYASFADSVLSWLGASAEAEVRARCRKAAVQFSWECFDERLAALLQPLLRVPK